ncbi:MAG: biotin/lipoyl-binding protein [Ruminococcaceae bacterium]|jgi:biotin carboxyl carrier protein|nr:biotin/lipoyl-binding protein [Oscillospiraceae bacterium]
MKKYIVNVNGTKYEITLETVEGAEAQAAPAAPAANVPTGGEKVSAPMPGTILDVKVNNGASVKKGDVLMILEAMKMENEIMAPCDGKVTVLTSKGATVESGTPLCTIE